MEGLAPAHQSDLNGTRCPGCGRDLCSLPPQASFCPDCRRRLRPQRTFSSIARSLARRLRRSGPPLDRTSPRAPVVIGYSNALWRLGWRYEHGRGVLRNVPEAMRCYRKSAGLGHVEAAARVEAAALPVAAVAEPDAT